MSENDDKLDQGNTEGTQLVRGEQLQSAVDSLADGLLCTPVETGHSRLSSFLLRPLTYANKSLEKFIEDMGTRHGKFSSPRSTTDHGQLNQHNHSSGSGGSRVKAAFKSPLAPKNFKVQPSDEELTNYLNNNNTKLSKNSSLGPWDDKHIAVVKFKAWIDKKPTTIDDTCPGVLKYKTPHFRAQATVELPSLGDEERLQIGWIQTCTSMVFVNHYGEEGLTSWEFPEITTNKYTMISDADGKLYPWYGAKKELKNVKGPSEKQSISIEMNDNFFPQVTWHIPDEQYDRQPRLTHIHRKQKFYTCLAVRDLVKNRIYIYKTLTWSMELNISVDPTKPLGERAKLEGPVEQEQPKVLKKNIQLPVYALRAPNANRSQVLVWRPAKAEPRVVVPPLESTINMSEYVTATKSLGEKLSILNTKH